MERLYRRNIITQQISFKYNYLTDERGSIKLKLFIWITMDILLSVIIVNVINFITQFHWIEFLSNILTFYIISLLKLTKLSLEWVNNVPIGLKLNNPLTEFIATKFINLLHLWEQFYISFLYHYLSLVLSLLLSLQYVGLSLLLAVSHDFLKFLNIYLICFYLISGKILSLQISALVSFWRLFRGQKYNPLRQRVDSCDYDTNQLILGTIFFTSLLFLLPTTVMFYVIFLSLRIVQFSIQFLIRLMIVLINKLTIGAMDKILSRYKTPRISTLKLVVSDKVDQNGRTNVEVLWNGSKWSPADIEKLVKNNKRIEKHNKLKKHSLMSWIDISCF